MTLAIGTKVRVRADWLARSMLAEQRRYAGRIGVVAGYRAGASQPFVDFPKSGRYRELRLYEVDMKHWMEVVPGQAVG